MRVLAVTFGALVMWAAPAQAAWEWYVCPSDNFAVQYPGPVKLENTTFSTPRHGKALAARKFTASVDNINYTMLIADYSDRATDGASIQSESMYLHLETEEDGLLDAQVLSEFAARVENPARGATYGRMVTVDVPNNGGRNTTAFYFRNGKLYKQTVAVLPANGDYGSPNPTRFVNTLLFNLSRLEEMTGGQWHLIQGCGATIQPFTFK